MFKEFGLVSEYVDVWFDKIILIHVIALLELGIVGAQGLGLGLTVTIPINHCPSHYPLFVLEPKLP